MDQVGHSREADTNLDVWIRVACVRVSAREIAHMRFLPRWQRLTVQYSHAQLIRNTLRLGLHERLHSENYRHRHARKKALNEHTRSHKAHTHSCAHGGMLPGKGTHARTAAQTKQLPTNWPRTSRLRPRLREEVPMHEHGPFI